MVRYNINKVRQTTPLKCLYIDHQHICIYSCHRYNRWVPGLPVDVVREFEGSTWSSGDRTDRWTTASHLHSPAVVRNTTSWEYSWLAGHQQVPEDPAAVGAGTCCIFQGFPPQYYRVMYGAVISDFSRGKFLFFIFNSFCIHFTQTRMRRESFLPDLLVQPFIVSIKEVTPHFMTKKPWCCWCWLILFFSFFLPFSSATVPRHQMWILRVTPSVTTAQLALLLSCISFGLYVNGRGDCGEPGPV